MAEVLKGKDARVHAGRILLAGKPLSYWKDLAAEFPAEPKSMPKSFLARIPREKMKLILDGISNDSPEISATMFDSISPSFPSMHIEDVIEICKTEIGSGHSNTPSVLLILANYYANAEDTVKKTIELVLITGIQAYAKNGWVIPVADLFKRNDLSDTVKKEIESALIIQIQAYANEGWRNLEIIKEWVRLNVLSDKVMSKAIDVLVENNGVSFIVNLRVRNDLSDNVMIKVIDICVRYGWINHIPVLLKRNDLSDKVMIKVIKLCANNGRIDVIIDLFGRDGLSDAVRNEIEPALIIGIPICGKNGFGVICSVHNLFKKEGLSDAVIQAATKETSWYMRVWRWVASHG